MTILVTGARGNIGKHIVAKLAAGGHSVRGSARDISGLQLPPGAEAVELDILKPVERAFDGVTAIFLYPTRSAPSDFLAAARSAGVQYIVPCKACFVRQIRCVKIILGMCVGDIRNASRAIEYYFRRAPDRKRPGLIEG